MTSNEARLILCACRPGGQDDHEPQVAAALELLRQDPELARSHEHERAVDQVICGKLEQVLVPARLKAEILVITANDVVDFRVGWRAWGMAAVAALVVILGVLWQMNRPTQIPADALAATAVETLNQQFSLSRNSADVRELQNWLAARKSPVPMQLPASFATLHGLGCKELTVAGNKVSLICFQHGGKEVHLFVMKADALSPEARNRDPRFSQRGAWALAQWSDERFSYVLASALPVEELRRLL